MCDLVSFWLVNKKIIDLTVWGAFCRVRNVASGSVPASLVIQRIILEAANAARRRAVYFENVDVHTSSSQTAAGGLSILHALDWGRALPVLTGF